jgi:hypothetical protein
MVQRLDNLCGHHRLKDPDPLTCPDLWARWRCRSPVAHLRAWGKIFVDPALPLFTSNTSPNPIPESTEKNAD